MIYQLGLKAPRVGAVKLRSGTYANYSALPTPPAEFGHADLIGLRGMMADGPDPLAPDVIACGDCAWVAGLLDGVGNRHKIVAYVDLNPGDLRELWAAAWLFQSVTLGFAIPGRKAGMNRGVTWGALQPFTDVFYEKYSRGGVVTFSEEMLSELGSTSDTVVKPRAGRPAPAWVVTATQSLAAPCSLRQMT